MGERKVFKTMVDQLVVDPPGIYMENEHELCFRHHMQKLTKNIRPSVKPKVIKFLEESMRKSLCLWLMQRFLSYNKVMIHERENNKSVGFYQSQIFFLKNIVKTIKGQVTDLQKVFTKHTSNISKLKNISAHLM